MFWDSNQDGIERNRQFPLTYGTKAARKEKPKLGATLGRAKSDL